MRKPIMAGNWKLNKNHLETLAFIDEITPVLSGVGDVDIVICPPFTSLNVATARTKGTNIKIGAQDLFWEKSGAYTGEISGEMLKVLGCDYVIIGHSERRQYFGETNQTINKKIFAAFASGLIPIVCVGETWQERSAGQVEQVLSAQIREGLQGLNAEYHGKIVIAYEPVWAIGTGQTATPAQANEAHVLLRKLLGEIFAETAQDIRIQYGGSVKPENVRELMAQSDIDGALIGGAALKAASFEKLVKFKG
ncbi:triosephosphate isomerase [Candidatus Termititenax persephonae]|uniref:Triosephosphate isomerase n=1 Tax=Candidatus Termititenax persephonae TaxID=2218525 RepID=A0A388TJJ9_9BACT|nr:triosephosphate isomerase [Candidatus Termititenax persephonae]